MKLDKLLRNNTFLISSGVYLIILLTICYLGLNSPVKKTYSVTSSCHITEDGTEVCLDSSKYQLYGEYVWGDEPSFPDGQTTFSIDVSLVSNEENFNGICGLDLSGALNTKVYIGYVQPDDSVCKYIYNTIPGGHFPDGITYRYLTFSTIVEMEQWEYEWFLENATAANGCYKNSSDGKYYWNNIPSTGDLQEDITTKTACEAKNTYELYGQYYWNDNIEYPSASIFNDKVEANFISGGQNFIGFFGTLSTFNDYDYSIGYIKAEDSSKITIYDANSGTTPDTWPDGNKYRWFTFTSPLKVEKWRYDWFLKNTTASNACYLNSSDGKYYWNNIPSTGTLQEGITNQNDCEAYNVKYNVKYDMTGGTGGPNDQVKTKSQTLKLHAVSPTKTGYTFTGWNTNKDGTGTSYSPGGNYTADADVTLYAQWKIQEYTVTYNANNGSNLSKTSDTVVYNSAVKLPSVSRSGYTFKGWYTATSGGTKVGGADESYTVTETTTLYAQWTQNVTTYKVTFNGNGGTAAKANVSVESGKKTTLPTATRDGFDFTGWYTSATGGTKVGTAGENYTVTGTIALYAQWKEQEVAIDFGEYKDNVKDDYIIVDLGTKKTDFESNIKFSITGYKASVEDKDGLLYTSGKLKISKSDNSVYKEYLIVVLYDLDGDGEVTTKDYMLLYKYLAEELKVEESGLKYFMAAADINKDKTLTTLDYMLIYNKLKEAV